MFFKRKPVPDVAASDAGMVPSNSSGVNLSCEPPQTYAQWSHCLDLLETAHQDEIVLTAMTRGAGDFGSGVVENLARRTTAVFDGRLQRANDAFARQLDCASDPTTMARALLDLRRQLVFLARVARLEVWPATLQTHLDVMLDGFAQGAQNSLEDSARTDRSGQTMQLVRRNALLNFRQDLAQLADDKATETAAPPSSRRQPRAILR